MKILLYLTILIASSWAAPRSWLNNNFEAAKPCDPNLCKLPKCLCSSTTTPGGLNAADVPQLVLLTFDDAVNIQNRGYYERALFNRVNPDGCPIGTTFFVSHEYTNYSMAHELWTQGFEIALHSITHQPPTDYWKDISVEELHRQFADQLLQFSEFAKIPKSDIKGLRLPFLQLSGDNSFELIKEAGLKYDCSWPTQAYMESGLWPYTLDSKSIQDCPIPPCPTSNISGVWTIPMVDWTDNSDRVCAMVDSCADIPTDVDGILKFMIRNFERHYTNENKSPFGFYVHASWFDRNANNFEAYLKFLDYLQGLNDVYLVNAQRALEWVQNPSTLANLKNSWPQCQPKHESACKISTNCQFVTPEGMYRNMVKCGADCPATYPWLGNPLGSDSS